MSNVVLFRYFIHSVIVPIINCRQIKILVPSVLSFSMLPLGRSG
jgi:hypothetical protein